MSMEIFSYAQSRSNTHCFEFCKLTFERLRPCNTPELKNIIRLVHHSKSFSFFSGHAANSIASMTFLFLILKKWYKYSFLIYLYPLIFAYSRIYLGVHYPIDIIAGFIFGWATGILFYKGYIYFIFQYTLYKSLHSLDINPDYVTYVTSNLIAEETLFIDDLKDDQFYELYSRRKMYLSK